MSALDHIVNATRIALRVALFAVLLAWALDLPTRWGLALYTEQFLAAVAGLCTAMVLIEGWRQQGMALRALSTALAAVALAVFGWVALYYPTLQLALVLAPPGAVLLGLVLIVAVMEATRRTTGPFLPVLIVVMMAFAFVGPYLPAAYETRPVTFSRLIVYLALDTNALLGKILAIAAIVVVPFIVFGVLLNAFGGSAFFSSLAARAVGRYRGGPAKVSVVGSAAFGMVSGSAVANVVAVGSVSIPMMARAGYRRHTAAAIEAVSSTGGQLMPPIMGAAAFLMAELLELPYQTIVIAAILPSLFFYLALFLAVDFEARRLDLGGGDAAELAKERIRGWRFLLPVAVLLYLLFVEKRTAEYAGMVSVGALLLVWLAWPWHGFAERARKLVRAMLDAMGAIPDIVMIAAAAGLIIGVLNITGISFALTLQMLALSQHSLALLLVLTAGLSILLGLGMPTVGVYILLATLAAPALVELGIEPLAAHFYVQYFGMLSMITPPIAIASFAAASVAGVDPWKTSFASLRVAAGVYLIPVAFVLEPELLFVGALPDTALAALRLAVSVVLLTVAAVGHANRPINPALRLAAALLAVLNILPRSFGAGDLVLWAAGLLGAALIAYAVWPRPAPRLAVERPPHG